MEPASFRPAPSPARKFALAPLLAATALAVILPLSGCNSDAKPA